MIKELYDMRVRSLAILVICLVLFFTLAPFQGKLLGLMEEYKDIVEKYAGSFPVEKLKEWNFYIYSQWFGKNLGQIIPIIGVLFAFPLFSREYENGTMEFLLVRKSRRYVFLSKTLTAILVMTVELVFFAILPVIYSSIAGKNFESVYSYQYMVHILVGGLFWFSITLLFSTIFEDQVRPLLFSLGLIAITTVVGLIKPLRFLNTYRYILGSGIMKGEGIDVSYTVYLSIVSLVLIFISYLIFKEKDI